MAILKVRDNNGNIIEIPAMKGENGKSAYEYAKEGGYAGTEQEFMELLVQALSVQTQLNSKAPMYQSGTTDLTAGTSALANGTLYFVYE